MKYDYLTATYLLLLTKKMRGQPVRLVQRPKPLTTQTPNNRRVRLERVAHLVSYCLPPQYCG